MEKPVPDKNPTRRRLLRLMAGVASFGLVLPLMEKARANTLRISARERKCATCNFWLGRRELGADRTFVLASGTGLCINPDSPAYNRQTNPNAGANVWRKWDHLP